MPASRIPLPQASRVKLVKQVKTDKCYRDIASLPASDQLTPSSLAATVLSMRWGHFAGAREVLPCPQICPTAALSRSLSLHHVSAPVLLVTMSPEAAKEFQVALPM